MVNGVRVTKSTGLKTFITGSRGLLNFRLVFFSFTKIHLICSFRELSVRHPRVIGILRVHESKIIMP